MIKSSKIDLRNLDSLKAAAHIIYPEQVTLLSIIYCHSEQITDLFSQFPWYDFDIEGSYITYPKSKLKQYSVTPYFTVVSICSDFSNN